MEDVLPEDKYNPLPTFVSQSLLRSLHQVSPSFSKDEWSSFNFYLAIFFLPGKIKCFLAHESYQLTDKKCKMLAFEIF